MREAVRMAVELIKAGEGFSATEYICPAGYNTIGYGRNLYTNPITYIEQAKYTIGDINLLGSPLNITKEIASEWVAEEAQHLYERLQSKDYFCHLNDARQAVLIDMAYNMGFGKLQKFNKMKLALVEEDYERAAAEMRDSLWFKQVKSRGERNVKIMIKGAI